MVIGYLNESRDPYLDNFQSDLIFTTLLSSLSLFFFFFFFFFFFLSTLDDPVLNIPEHFKILSNIVNIKWQSLKTFHRGKLEILRKNGQK